MADTPASTPFDPDETIVRPASAPGTPGPFGPPEEPTIHADETLVQSAPGERPEPSGSSEEATIRPGGSFAGTGAHGPFAAPEESTARLAPDHPWNTPAPAPGGWPAVAPLPTPAPAPHGPPAPTPAPYGWASTGPEPWRNQSNPAGYVQPGQPGQPVPPGYPGSAGYPTSPGYPAAPGGPAARSSRRRFGRWGFIVVVLAVCVVLGAAATGITILATRDGKGPTTAQALITTPPSLVAQLPADPDRSRTVYSFAFSADGKRLAVADGGTTADYTGQAALRQWEMKGGGATPAEIGRSTIARPDWWGVAFAPDLRTVAVGISDVVLLDIHDPARTTALSEPFAHHPGVGHRALFSPDGDLLAIATPDGALRLWNVSDRANPKPTSEPFGGGGAQQVLGIDFSPDGRTLAVASSDSLVRLWNISDRAHPAALGQPLTGHVSGVWNVAFSPDGKTLATAGGDRTIRLWDVSDPARPRPLGPPLTGHAGGVLAVRFSPDGTVLASHGPDNVVHLWNVADPAHAAPLGQPLADQWGATFSPDGNTLATVGIDNTIRLWRLR